LSCYLSAIGWGHALDVRREIIGILDRALGLGGRAGTFTDATPLLGSVPELDSMGVVTTIGMLEERFGLTVADDEIDGATFATLGSLTAFVTDKLRT
jgi:acyl carrier protein